VTMFATSEKVDYGTRGGQYQGQAAFEIRTWCRMRRRSSSSTGFS
jgi:hypothetical protein